MFAQGSVLPMPGGSALMDGLAALLKRSGRAWQLTLRAETGLGQDYDTELAAKRALVLETYLKSAGLNMGTISLASMTDSGAPFSLQLKQERQLQQETKK